MDKLTRLLAFIWVLSTPFYSFSIVASFSLDNLIAPVLVLIASLRLAFDSKPTPAFQSKLIFSSLVVAGFYFLSHTAGLVLTRSAVFSSAYTIASSMLYFFLPVLLIRSVKDYYRILDALLVTAVIASATALFSALGFLQFDFYRYAESRVGIETLQKAVGLFTSYGDAAILLSFSLVLSIANVRGRYFFGDGSKLKVVVSALVVLTGLASMQSRNMVLTIVTSLISFWIIGTWMRKYRRWSKRLYLAVFIAIAAITITLFLFSGPLLDFIRGVGGTKEAAGTVDARLSQYAFMWELVKDRFLLGVSSANYERYATAIALIHNMWLKELVHGGLLAVISMFVIWWHALVAQVDNYKRGIIRSEARATISVLLAMLIASQFYPAGALIFWMYLGIFTAKPYDYIGASHTQQGKAYR